MLLKKQISNERGVAVSAVVAVVAVLLILGFAAIYLVESEQVLTVRDYKSKQAFHIADAGLDDYVWSLNIDPTRGHPAVGSWVDYSEGEDEEVIGQYYIEIIETEEDSPDRTITVKVTGRSKTNSSVQRSVRAKVKRATFLDYLWFTDSEKNTRGQKVSWISVDELKGPFRTNEDVYIDGTPRFEEQVRFVGVVEYEGEEFSPNDPEGRQELDDLQEQGILAGGWQRVAEVPFPRANTLLADDARAGGYYYTGDTTIEIDSDELSVSEKRQGSNRNNEFDHPLGDNVGLPGNGVIYVEGDAYVEGTLNGKLTLGASNNIYITGDLVYANGNLDPTDSGCSDDVLGLVANKNTYIKNTRSNPIPSGSGMEIDAAIVALSSFALQNYGDANDLGTLRFRGAMVQGFRGAVATFSDSDGEKLTGFDKDYRYDERLRYTAYEPPHFIQPGGYCYEVASWKEIR